MFYRNTDWMASTSVLLQTQAAQRRPRPASQKQPQPGQLHPRSPLTLKVTDGGRTRNINAPGHPGRTWGSSSAHCKPPLSGRMVGFFFFCRSGWRGRTSPLIRPYGETLSFHRWTEQNWLFTLRWWEGRACLLRRRGGPFPAGVEVL